MNILFHEYCIITNHLSRIFLDKFDLFEFTGNISQNIR
jgi:hypothetical protein